MDNYSEYIEETIIIDQNMDNYLKSLLEDQIIENEEGNVENILLEDENDENYKIPEVKTLKWLPCVIFDNLNKEIKCCNSTTKLVSLSQLIGTCEIEITLEENSDITELEVCSSHFNFDNSKLHSSGAKQRKKLVKV
ncbi:hypothetical protein F8M41_011452 [Gigaspora margarita]|uniref:Uncharacterized protein n=1 Tax=Gigaspora margarita TaxID=4874 RepID=A0A8H3X0B1_GIGMA|nr:hypothetical protein F8M41_011452 [Gigaspora margarita]